MTNSSDMDGLEKAAAQMLMVGFHGAPAAVPDAIRQALGDGLGGVVLFRRNIEDIHQLMALTDSILQAAPAEGPTPFVAVDQEGGRVVRLREPLTPIPPLRKIGDRTDPAWTKDVSAMMARELKAVGVNLNFAPVIDVDTNPDNPVIGDRSFSNDPQQVAEHGRAFVAGHLESGILPCAKHFPGHGDTHVDSHLDLPRLAHELTRLEHTELYPFAELFQDDPPLVMTAHILFEALDPQHPATLSRAILQGLLREKLAYRGLVISDCLEMNAVSKRYAMEEMIELGLDAGIDIFLICHTESLWRRAWDHLIHLGQKNEESRTRILASAQHIKRRKMEVLNTTSIIGDPFTLLGCKQHRSLISAVDLDQAITETHDPTESKA
ncbi:MAG: beta-N-acetylhexosaminidase [Myxococcota bacterium]|nr:beta-N-acetylhexosaminidase [Myxococcota bacterium]